jgi:hypothetical protein
MLTADTITDEHILTLRNNIWGRATREEWNAVWAALYANSSEEKAAGRSRCVEILNRISAQ